MNMLLLIPKLNQNDINHINWWLCESPIGPIKIYSRIEIGFMSKEAIRTKATAYLKEWPRSATWPTYFKILEKEEKYGREYDHPDA